MSPCIIRKVNICTSPLIQDSSKKGTCITATLAEKSMQNFPKLVSLHGLCSNHKVYLLLGPLLFFINASLNKGTYTVCPNVKFHAAIETPPLSHRHHQRRVN